jgi:hypothetical protein
MKPATLGLLLAAAPAWSQGDNCDALRQQIDDRIRAAGVAAYTVTVANAAASAPGKVVGQCAQGRRKIVYQRIDVADVAASGRPAAPAARASMPVLTECKDGSVSVGGDCTKR